MKLIRGLRNLGQGQRGSVVTIGTYDGIHLGHQALIQRTIDQGARLSRPTMMLTFEPMPREYFAPQDPPARLTSLRERWRVLERAGLESVGLLRFDERLRNLSGESFAQMLARDLAASVVIVGHDFKFGSGGAATAEALEEAGRRLGFEVEVVPPVQVDGVRVSSTGIRDALARSDFALAQRWLGRPYSMIGRVIEGERLGRKLGFATANLELSRLKSPVQGVFAVRVCGAAQDVLTGVASLGTRPTVNGTVPLLEVHLFDFEGELYGREIEVEFVEKLREEVRFPSLEELVAQMHRDAFQARRVLLE